jgi:arginyl-tRNA synthetase
MALIKGYDSSSLEQEFIEAFKNHMRELYNRLETEYEHLTSDESVLESLDANDMLEDLINDHMECEDA